MTNKIKNLKIKNLKPDTKNAIKIKGEYHRYKDWEQDPKGYFLIKINKKKKIIEVGYCKKNNVIEIIVYGKTPQEIYYTIIKKGLISRLDHAAYLGKELQKAYYALKYNKEYVQDEDW